MQGQSDLLCDKYSLERDSLEGRGLHLTASEASVRGLADSGGKALGENHVKCDF